MAKSKKPTVNLGEIKKHGKLFGSLYEASKAPTGQGQINAYLGYLKEEQKLSEDDLPIHNDLMTERPSLARDGLISYLTKHQGNVIKEVSKNPRTVLSKLEAPMLMKLANPHIGNDEYKTMVAVLENGEPAQIGNLMMGLYKTDSWQMLVSGSSSAALKEVLGKEAARRRTSHLTKDLGYDAKTGKIDENKTAGYLAPKITSDEDKLQIGLSYANQK